MGWAWAAVSSSPSSSVCSLSPLPSPALASGPPATDAHMIQPGERDWGPPIHPPNPPPTTHLPTHSHPPTYQSIQPARPSTTHPLTHLSAHPPADLQLIQPPPIHPLSIQLSVHPLIHAFCKNVSTYPPTMTHPGKTICWPSKDLSKHQLDLV